MEVLGRLLAASLRIVTIISYNVSGGILPDMQLNRIGGLSLALGCNLKGRRSLNTELGSDAKSMKSEGLT